MKLDRTTTSPGKYSLILNRKLDGLEGEKRAQAEAALDTLDALGVIDASPAESPGEFFVIRLRDQYARGALLSYAAHAMKRNTEYATAVLALANRAGDKSPFCKLPD